MVAVEHRPGKPQGEPGLDSVQPESGWFMFERKAEVEDEGSPVGRGGVRVGRGTSEVKRSWASLRLGKAVSGNLYVLERKARERYRFSTGAVINSIQDSPPGQSP